MKEEEIDLDALKIERKDTRRCPVCDATLNRYKRIVIDYHYIYWCDVCGVYRDHK